MARHSRKLREEARRLYLTMEVTSVSEIARRLKVKPHTVGVWKKEEDWEALLVKVAKQSAEKLVEKLANERVSLNAQHYKFWNVVGGRLIEAVQKDPVDGEEIKNLEKIAATLEKMQKGQRLSRGLALDGQTEEQIRAQSESENRALVDLFMDLVKANVQDESIRDAFARGIYERLPKDPEKDDTA